MKIFDHLDKLKAFITVVDSGSINGAVMHLALSQPAITRSIQTLENAVGFSLFNRDRNGMHLTDGGKILYTTGRRVLKEIADATKKGANAQSEMVGNLSIGTYESLTEYLLPKFLLKIQKDYPLLNISLKTNSHTGHMAELSEGVLDLLIDAEPRGHAALTQWPLYSDSFSFYYHHKIKLTTELAVKFPLLYVQNAIDENNITLEQYLIQNELTFKQEYIFDSFTSVKRMAIEGLGIAILPQKLVNQEDGLFKIKVKGLSQNFSQHRIFATVSPLRENDQRLKKLIAILRKQLR